MVMHMTAASSDQAAQARRTSSASHLPPSYYASVCALHAGCWIDHPATVHANHAAEVVRPTPKELVPTMARARPGGWLVKTSCCLVRGIVDAVSVCVCVCVQAGTACLHTQR
jgi:hypothetical protein